jgi:hypothetical protein
MDIRNFNVFVVERGRSRLVFVVERGRSRLAGGKEQLRLLYSINIEFVE